MPVSREKLEAMYDRLSLRLTPGYKTKLQKLADENNLTTTAYIELLIDRSEAGAKRKKSTLVAKKE